MSALPAPAAAARPPSPAEQDPFDARLARAATGVLRDYNHAGVLSAADVHVSTRLAGLCGEHDELVVLAAALAVRAPRLGHVHVDLHTIADTAAVESDETAALSALPWPDPEAWLAAVGASPLVAVVGAPDAGPRPLRLDGRRLYLDRYWAEEAQVADDLLAMTAGEAPPVDERWLADQLASLFGAERGADVDDARQRLACATAVLRRLSVIAGGPGTGKTTTVARVAALLVMQAHASGQRPPLIALAAPTGKAAVRLEQAVHDAARSLPLDDAARRALLELKGSTLHRLLGRRPGSVSRFRHDRHHRLPHDVVVVDETSMVSLSLMARLTEAVRPQARLVLVGDPDQLASIEAGAVLGDIVGPAADGLVMGSRPARPTAQSGAPTSIAGGIVILDRGFRFGTGIAALAEAVRRGDSDAVLARLRDGSDDVQWLSFEAAADAQADALEPIRAVAAQSASEVIAAARAGQADQALDALGRFRLLCGHRRGPHGVSGWTARVESWLAGALVACDTDDPWYPGRPLLVTENDYELGLYNGDTGVIVAREHGRVGAAFARRGEIVEHIPTRLGAVQTLYAMTIHKSQGSQFDVAAVLLPGPDSRILSRELLYTAITRARHRLLLAGSEAAIRVAVERPVARASGLGERLWKAPAVLRARA